MTIKNRPNPNEAFPNPNIPSLCYIKNVVKNPRIIIGDYTYYDDVDGADQFEKHVTHFYDFIGDKLIIGKFSSLSRKRCKRPSSTVSNLIVMKMWMPTTIQTDGIKN